MAGLMVLALAPSFAALAARGGNNGNHSNANQGKHGGEENGEMLQSNNSFTTSVSSTKPNEEKNENHIVPRGPEPAVRILPNNKVNISGAKVDSISTSSGSTTLVISVFGLKFNVDATNAKVIPMNSKLFDLMVNDVVSVNGTINDTTGVITAKVINDITLRQKQQGNPVQPAVISDISVSGITSTSATVSWMTNELATSKVYFDTTSSINIATASSVSALALVKTHSLVLTNLAPNTTYFFIVESVNGSGQVTRSGVSSFTTLQVTLPIISGLTVSNVSSTSALVQWMTNVPATSKVYFSTSTPVNLTTASTTSDNTLVTSHSLNLTGLNASTTYFFVEQSTDAFNNIVTSSQQSFITP